ncbi:MAG: SufD family Fe-S cluster assembly protein [Deltaproteobacteria bacterium]|nr:SufD family Fe-S cluster assembly protein [Deltaproteobacteria bacterium]
MRKIDNAMDVSLEKYDDTAEEHSYVEKLTQINPTDTDQFLNVGVDIHEEYRSGTFIQKDNSVIHSKTLQDGVEVMSISRAQEKHPWLDEYIWKSVSPETDKFTAMANEKPREGYFIRSLPGVKVEHPVQACLYIEKEGFAQNVHNIVIAEENSEIHIITGCATAPHLMTGLHVGVSEFYVKKGAKLTFTMIHDWGDKINVRPRTVTHVEEDGVIVSNYISLKPVGSLQMNPITYLDGKGAVARFNSVLVAGEGSHMDVGSTILLNQPNTRAEIISRAIVSGGTIIARGNMVGKVADIKAHLECKGLVLKDGLMQAVPELQGHVPGVDMSHEAAVGKIDKREIEYLMARGLNEEEAISTIVRGFLNVQIEGLPVNIAKKLDKAISETEKDMM